LEEMSESGDADNQSEALRSVVTAGLHQKGYLTANGRKTPLREASRRLGETFALLGVIWLGVSFWLPIEMRSLVVAPLAASVACFGIERALRTWEPAVSKRLLRVFGREA
jgi:hypothetical protein